MFNSLANIGDLGRYYIQQQNITHKLTKTHNLDQGIKKMDLTVMKPPIESDILITVDANQDINQKNEDQYEIPVAGLQSNIQTISMDPSKSENCNNFETV
jgi:hypothetical protein